MIIDTEGDFIQSGSPGRIRTSDPTVNSRLLCQLSYRGVEKNPKSNVKSLLHESLSAVFRTTKTSPDPVIVDPVAS